MQGHLPHEGVAFKQEQFTLLQFSGGRAIRVGRFDYAQLNRRN